MTPDGGNCPDCNYFNAYQAKMCGLCGEVLHWEEKPTSIDYNQQLKDHRVETLEVSRENDDVMKGWMWFAMLNYDTCISCILKHGTIYPLDVPMECHDGCRCTNIPVSKTFAELGAVGAVENDTHVESGRDWFNRQSRAIQKLRSLARG